MLHYLPREIREDMRQLPFALYPEEFDKLPDPRVLRPHTPIDLLPPDLLEVSKVFELIKSYLIHCIYL